MLSSSERANLLAMARAATPGNRNASLATNSSEYGMIYAENGEPMLQVLGGDDNKNDIAFYAALYPSKAVALLEENQFLSDLVSEREAALKAAIKRLYDEANDRSQTEDHTGDRYAWSKVRMEVHKLASELNTHI